MIIFAFVHFIEIDIAGMFHEESLGHTSSCDLIHVMFQALKENIKINFRVVVNISKYPIV